MCAGDIFAHGGGASLTSQLGLLCPHTLGRGKELRDSQGGMAVWSREDWIQGGTVMGP